MYQDRVLTLREDVLNHRGHVLVSKVLLRLQGEDAHHPSCGSLTEVEHVTLSLETGWKRGATVLIYNTAP